MTLTGWIPPFDESASGTETAIQVPREETCDTCRGTGGAEGSGPEVCRQCGGHGQLRFQQGFFTVARTGGMCRGTGRVITKPCSTCRGAGRTTKDRRITVKVPPGISSGQRLRIAGEGEHGFGGGPPGDLYVVVQVAEHPLFRRDGDELYCDVEVPFPTLALGGTIPVPGLNEEHTVEIPAGTQAGSAFRLRGKGMPNVTGRGRGALPVQVKVNVPRKLTRERMTI